MTAADRIARRDTLYLIVGRAIHTSQLLESQLRLVLAVLEDELEVQIDYRSLAAPDNKKPLGKLMSALSSAGTTSPGARDVLADAIQARNRIAHQFFVRNVDATTDAQVFAAAHSALLADSEALSAGAATAHALLIELCRVRGIDDNSLVVKQDRVAHDM